MARQFRLWEDAKLETLLPAASDAAGRTGYYVSTVNAHKVYIVCEVNQGNAAEVTFTPLQATSAAGANSKGISQAAPIVANLATGAGDTLAIYPSASSFTTDAGLADKLVVFELLPESMLDLNNSTIGVGAFQYFGVQTEASDAANVTAAWALLVPLRAKQQIPYAADV